MAYPKSKMMQTLYWARCYVPLYRECLANGYSPTDAFGGAWRIISRARQYRKDQKEAACDPRRKN